MTRSRDQAAVDAETAGKAVLASIGVDLMNAYNTGRHDPSFMAVNGHDTQVGYEFFIQRDGRTAVISVIWDLE